MLIQLQSDRLLLNWRRGAQNAEYPHFEVVSAEFRRIYQLFAEFCTGEKLGTIEPTRCEMTYVNHISNAQESGAPWQPEDWLRLWSGVTGPEWPVRSDGVSFNLKYRIREDADAPLSYLVVSAQSLKLPHLKNVIPQVGITVLGRPSEASEAAVCAFHQMAHRQIVNCFTGITTENAHLHWGRWR